MRVRTLVHYHMKTHTHTHLLISSPFVSFTFNDTWKLGKEKQKEKIPTKDEDSKFYATRPRVCWREDDFPFLLLKYQEEEKEHEDDFLRRLQELIAIGFGANQLGIFENTLQ